MAELFGFQITRVKTEDPKQSFTTTQVWMTVPKPSPLANTASQYLDMEGTAKSEARPDS